MLKNTWHIFRVKLAIKKLTRSLKRKIFNNIDGVCNTTPHGHFHERILADKKIYYDITILDDANCIITGIFTLCFYFDGTELKCHIESIKTQKLSCLKIAGITHEIDTLFKKSRHVIGPLVLALILLSLLKRDVPLYKRPTNMLGYGSFGAPQYDL